MQLVLSVSRSITNNFCLFFIPPVLGVTRKRADGTEVSKGGRDEVRPVYREEFADAAMSILFAERA